jgi:hypothetical protein
VLVAQALFVWHDQPPPATALHVVPCSQVPVPQATPMKPVVRLVSEQ